MDKNQAVELMHKLLAQVKLMEGSDLFITAGFPPAVKVDGEVNRLGDKVITGEQSAVMVRSLMRDDLLRRLDAEKECNFAIYPQGIGRFRVNVFVQQGRLGAVLRRITTEVPSLDDLALPATLKDVVMEKRGLVLVVGATGSGKSTTLAAMINHRNNNSRGHIITIEDPVEFMHRHAGCIITQREVGVDTKHWGAALKNALRQAPDVILIGEVRDKESMEYALQFSETGHLCLATLHANNANQALERVSNFFPQEKREQMLMDLSLNLKAVISQRLLRKQSGDGRIAAVEIMLNSPLIADMIFRGEIAGIKEIMAKSKDRGMATFDQALVQLYEQGQITEDEAVRNADSSNEVRLAIRMKKNSTDLGEEIENLSIAEEAEEARDILL